MQTDRQIQSRQPLQPGDVGADLGRIGLFIIAVQVDPRGILATVELEAGRIEARTKPEFDIGGPSVFPEQSQCSQRPCGFIAVDARRKIDPLTRRWDWPMQRQTSHCADRVQRLDLPAVFGGRLFEFPCHGTDIDGFTAVPRKISARLGHDTIRAEVAAGTEAESEFVGVDARVRNAQS